MRTGYLYVEIHPLHPGQIRICQRDSLPDAGQRSNGASIEFIVRFSDIDAAQMHVHQILRHKLIDIDKHLYQASLAEAIAAIDASDLPHEQIWQDPSLDEPTQARVRQFFTDIRQRQQSRDMFWRSVGIGGIVTLILLALIPF